MQVFFNMFHKKLVKIHKSKLLLNLMFFLEKEILMTLECKLEI